MFASDLPLCSMCEEPFCPSHNKHYADCDCIGPTQDGYEYQEVNGILYTRKEEEPQ